MITAKMRLAVWERDGGRCGFCGEPVAFAEMDIDHEVPRSQGGTDTQSNLRPAHRYCNRSSGLNSPHIPKHYSGQVARPIRLAPDVYAGAWQAAADAGVTLNAWFVEAMREKLQRENKG